MQGKKSKTKADLERELGIYQKKTENQKKIISELKAENREMRAGLMQVNSAVDTVLNSVLDVFAGPGPGMIKMKKSAPDSAKKYTLDVGLEDGIYTVRRVLRPSGKDAENETK